MLRYVGGKTRLAKEISTVLSGYKTPTHKYYYEPFFGGGSMAQYTKQFGLQRFASDNNKDLINLYVMLQMEWLPPIQITEDEYKRLKESTDPSIVASAMRGYAGFALSFGGKWFGGYARDPKGGRDFSAESYRRLVKHLPDIEDIYFRHTDYRFIFPVNDECLIYCDPPYYGTFGETCHYEAYAIGDFDHISFWNTMREWSNNGAVVLISEYTAPNDFEVVWEKSYKTYGITLGKTQDKVERLFKYKG